MRTALFAEGPNERISADHAFYRLWQDAVLSGLGLPTFDFVYAINKKFVISMRLGSPPISGASIKLDALIEQKRREDGFDCAVVAWDLVPGWAGGTTKLCRWEETLEFYRGIGRSEVLPPNWVAYAKARDAELSSRAVPSQRPRLTKLAPGACLALCMESMFESLIASDEKAVRALLGCAGTRVPDWPKAWKAMPHFVDSQLIDPSIRAVRALRPKRDEAYVVRGDMITHKHEWGYFFLKRMLGSTGSAKARSHSIALRLADIL